jgi:predicted amidohydrolase
VIVAAVQLDIAWHDPAANRACVAAMLRERRLPAGSFVLLPELFDVGFSTDLPAILPSDAPGWAAALARELSIFLQVGFPELGPDGFGRNCMAIARPDGTLAPTYAKVHPFGYGRETESFRGGERLVLVPCGELLAMPAVCYDLRFPELFRHAALAGADLISIGASWPEPRAAAWRALAIARAIENQTFVVAGNRVGTDPNARYSGGSLVVSPEGEVLAEGDARESIVEAECDAARCAAWRAKFPALRDARPSLLGSIEIVRSR